MAAAEQRFLTAYKTLGCFHAEVFKVVYLGNEEVTPDKQLGTIKVRNHKYHHYIYNVDNADTIKSSIKHGDQLTLTGPSLAPISCPSGMLVIQLDLFGGAFKGSKRIDWAPFPGTNECAFLEKRFKSRDGRGEIIIFLGMFYYATEAFLDVSLFSKNSSAVAVGGVIVARPSNSLKPEFSSFLFSKNSGCSIKVQSGEQIPLSRSITVLPLKCKLFLDINLSCDDENITSTLEFDAHLKGTFHKTLLGTKCEIKAKVIWNVKHKSFGALNAKCVYSEEDDDSDEEWLTDDEDDWLA
ncbi:hypothetical protein POM88_002116 [Heracleum sosnowskyi]|uniref:DUF6598 domain-containing protein n=1 Tax=Heracleum sosnowskyi TaxID=360622 RepID=A0AAD8NBI0_9APIA|nr:hypothetical protein POM88_002110 [Heracleum sosnowskyi]KAK1402511.1 hypothetical protein POM88_002116 [Heracleum sosnowskyi]